MCGTCTRKYVYFGEIYTTGKNFTLPPKVVEVTNITSGLRHLVTYKAGLLKRAFWRKKTGPTVANQISVGEKMAWGRQWKRKIGYKSIFTAKLPAFWPPAWGLINFQCIQNISEQAIFFFSVSQNAQELSWCNFADWMIVWDPCQNCYCQIWPKFKS